MHPANRDEVIGEHGVSIRAIRHELGFSQAEFARLVGFSTRAIQSCEQGWRRPGASLEKAALLLLIAHRNGGTLQNVQCWGIMNCPPERRQQCLTFRSGQGHLCWFLSGTLYPADKPGWDEKRGTCLQCRLFRLLLGEAGPA